ncbi:MAG: Hpt domain-containing protein [Clostridia bacterium]|nr:Hpt domain-containing protein [Clostridia bacterium]
MMNIARLEQAGVNYHKGVNRFLGDAELYELVLMSFLDSDILARSEDAYNSRDYKKLFECVHEMKGASGNADMEALYRISCTLTETLRNGNPDAAQTDVQFSQFRDTYKATMQAIREACDK